MLLIREIAPDRLWLLANSMGGQVVVDALRALHRDPDFADSDVEIDLVVLTAPDVDHRKFNEQFKGEIDALTRNLTVYVSSNGRALMMSRIINGSKRLGESTLGGLSPDQFAEAATIAELVEPGDELVTLVDVTPVNRTGNFHNFSLETPQVLRRSLSAAEQHGHAEEPAELRGPRSRRLGLLDPDQRPAVTGDAGGPVALAPGARRRRMHARRHP